MHDCSASSDRFFFLNNHALLPTNKLPAWFHDHRSHVLQDRGRLPQRLQRRRVLRGHVVRGKASMSVPGDGKGV
jgi:hypothetical protein